MIFKMTFSSATRTVAVSMIAAVWVLVSASVGQSQTNAQQVPRQRLPAQGPNTARVPNVVQGAQRAPVGSAPAGQFNPRSVPQGTAGQRVPPNQLQRQPQQPGRPQRLMVQAAPFKLTPAEKKRVDDLLGFWEFSSGKIQTYTTKFERLEFDPVFGPKDPRTPRTRGFGVIRYSAPDKGEFKLETIGEYVAPAKPGADTHPLKPVQFDEHWICDGKAVYEFNSKTKQLVETKLPPDMQGKRIADGPLPFMFGAKKAELLERYWIREIKNAKPGQYKLEIYPKRREDAMNYSRVMVIIAENDFLPMALQIFPPNYDPKKNPARTVYAFKDRQTNKPQHRAQQFFNRFVSPKPPIGWKKVVSGAGQPVPPGNVQQRAPQPQQGAPQRRVPQRRATATNRTPSLPATATNRQPTGNAPR